MKSAVLPSLKRKKILLSFFVLFFALCITVLVANKGDFIGGSTFTSSGSFSLSLFLSRGRSCAFRSHLLPRHSRTYLFLSTPATTNSWIERLETRELLGLLDKQTLAGTSLKCKIKRLVVFLHIICDQEINPWRLTRLKIHFTRNFVYTHYHPVIMSLYCYL